MYLVWQLVDSAFPSGGFAHSSGLEASMHHGLVTHAGDVRDFARRTVHHTGRASLPLVTAAHADEHVLPDLDGLSDSFLTNGVGNRASRALGRALLTSSAKSFPFLDVGDVEARVRDGRLNGHYAPIFGVVLARLGIERRTTQQVFLFLAARAVCSAAVRLGLVGGYEAQELQTSLRDDIDQAIVAFGSLEPHGIAQSAPLIDLCQSTHDRLYSRLFQS